MELLNKQQLNESIASDDENSIFLDPILDDDQVGDITIDLRLGYDFQVSILTRKPFIEIASSNSDFNRSIGSYFQETRREIGEKFVLYPNQVVLTTTLEYLALPDDMYIDVLSRSSYTRLGIHINTMVQPGFRGCIPLELFNHSNNAVELIVGSRICQSRFMKMNNLGQSYLEANEEPRKYYGNVRPTVSKADTDRDMKILEKINRDT